MTNTLFPGRPDYVGPTSGFFGLLHHDSVYEYSHNVKERIDYVENNKSKDEIGVRLHNMIYLGEFTRWSECEAKTKPIWDEYKAKMNSVWDEYEAKTKPIDEEYEAKMKSIWDEGRAKKESIWYAYYVKRDSIRCEYKAKMKLIREEYEAKMKPIWDEILAYIRKHIPDCAWDETRKELVFK